MNERRIYQRYECHIILAITLQYTKVVEFDGQAHNISQSGVIFTTPMDMEEGSQCKLAFEHDQQYIYSEGKVVRKEKTKNENKDFQYAIHFGRKMSEDEFESLLKFNELKDKASN
ncbi:MAG: PilZ domain-containing protein [Spirochaetes bacterium]|nr:PilZ domain-containing protein [Spirochaetota bacterium]